MRNRLRLFLQRPLAVFLFFLLVQGSLMKIAGPAALASDAKWYADAARELVACEFDFKAYFANVQSPISPVFYIGFVTLVALCQKVLGAYWLQGVLFCNLMALALTGTLIVALTLRLTRRNAVVLAALFLYLICVEIFNWARFVLTDTLFMAVSFWVFYNIACALLAEDKKSAGRYWMLSTLGLIIAPFCRPTGVILLATAALSFSLWFWRQKAPGKITAKQLWIGGGAAFSILAMASLSWAYWMQDLSRWPFPSANEALRLPYYARLYHEGIVINGRPYTYVAAPQSLLDYFALSVRRFCFFFAFWSSRGFSRGHNLALAFFFVPSYFFIATALVNFMRRRSDLTKNGRTVLAATFLFVGAFAMLHAHTEVDYDWRYRLPVMPHLVLLAALGFGSWWRKRLD